MYGTACVRHCALLPIEVPHSGHGKAVLLLSTRGTPDDVHTFALLAILFPRMKPASDHPFLGLIERTE